MMRIHFMIVLCRVIRDSFTSCPACLVFRPHPQPRPPLRHVQLHNMTAVVGPDVQPVLEINDLAGLCEDCPLGVMVTVQDGPVCVHFQYQAVRRQPRAQGLQINSEL